MTFTNVNVLANISYLKIHFLLSKELITTGYIEKEHVENVRQETRTFLGTEVPNSVKKRGNLDPRKDGIEHNRDVTTSGGVAPVPT